MKNLKYIIQDNLDLESALKKIEENKCGAVLVVDQNNTVKGLITDGDVRRLILAGRDTSEPVVQCYNPKFISVEEGASREKILKILDDQVSFLPVLNKENRLISVYTRKDFPIDQERSTLVRSRAPVRISFGGGGTDLTYFFSGNGGAVISATIRMYAHCELRKLDDHRIIINSLDLDKQVEVASVEKLFEHKGFELIASLLKLINPHFGFELTINCDFPIGSGLGGSSAVLASILGCFNQFRGDPWDTHEIAELAFQAERIYLEIRGGWQDQYVTVFGGFNFIEFFMDENIIHPLRISNNILWELEENLVLCSTGFGRSSGDIHVDQKKKFMDGGRSEVPPMKIRELTYKIKSNLLRGNLREFGKLLHEGWCLKKQFSEAISSSYIDEIYDIAMSNGALGGKLLGAGGGGFFLFYSEGREKLRLVKKLKELGLSTQNISFELEGLQSWKVRMR